METVTTFAVRCESLFSVWDVLSLVQPTAAIVAASRVAEIFPLRVMWPPRLVGRFIAVDHLKAINACGWPIGGKRENAMGCEFNLDLLIVKRRVGRVRPDT
jgi:hypothetical protein